MSDQPYCLRHNTRLMESGANRFYFDTYLIQWVVENHPDWFSHPDKCYLCMISETQIITWLKFATELEAKVEAGGGTFTTDRLAVFGVGDKD